MKLSVKAITDLRQSLGKTYGESFQSALTDEEVNTIGNLFLTVLAESLKIDIANPDLLIATSK